MAGGIAKMAKKVGEEAVEVGLDAVAGDRTAVIAESADLIYNLVVLWAASNMRRLTCGPRWSAASASWASRRSCPSSRT